AERARMAALEAGGGDRDADGEGGEEGIENDEEAERLEALGGLDQFVGRPLPGDELVAAIPVCAPWSALGNYKYKVKLQPGSQKKGKAMREILGAWDAAAKVGRNVDERAEDGERMWPREVELVRAFKETEVVGVVPVRTMRVMMQGGGGGKGGGAGGKGAGGGKKMQRGQKKKK
ncbi:hypothetical protein LTS18_004189, partial [Coniosporium uncinatum]